jgi:ABC-type dipeptide/oligopeptide/nickel transport system ATPase component
MSVAGLLPRKQCDYAGEVLLDGTELLHADRTVLRRLQGKDIGVVFQEPMSAMDPLMKIGAQVEEVLRIHTKLPRAERKRLALEALTAVELPEVETVYDKYPHELSGGMLQRAMIAAAIVARPKLLLLDEPTTALDVTIQAQILELLKKLNREFGISMLFISHDLNVVRRLCGRVAVMQRGVLVEEGDADRVFHQPRHPYTRRLIDAIPTRKRKEDAL